MANRGNREQHKEAGRRGGEASRGGSREQHREAGRKGAESRWGSEGGGR